MDWKPLMMIDTQILVGLVAMPEQYIRADVYGAAEF